jgi:hypothetical protein
MLLLSSGLLGLAGYGDKESRKERRNKSMKVYVAFRKDYEHRKGELLGMLVEKRNDARGLTQWESGLKWARGAFGHLVKDKKSIFVFPKELKVSEDKKLLVEKGIFTKEEYLEAMKKIGQKAEMR